jgi:hypothetical protein
MNFPDDIWNEIKNYFGVYSITTNWNLLKLTEKELINIIQQYINKNILYDSEYLKIKKNMGSVKKYLVWYFWKNVKKQNLRYIYFNYTCKYCPYDYKLYNKNDIYYLEKYKKDDDYISFTFGDETKYVKYVWNLSVSPFQVFNITNKYIELISINDISEKQQKIKIKKNICKNDQILIKYEYDKKFTNLH